MSIYVRRADRVSSNKGTRTTQMWRNWIRVNIKKNEAMKEKEPCQVKDEE